MSELITVVDLFAGAGGLSTGVARACERLGKTPGEDVELHAVNHWAPAIETHEQNHPWAEHYHAKIEELHPPDVVEPDTVTLLTGGPECVHFTTARGGKPVSEQKRASAWHVLDWVEKLRPDHVVLENVREFRSWGPIEDGQPTRDGSIFERWVGMFEALGYTVAHQVLNAADYGDATARKRLFIVACREKQPTFPDPTHSDQDTELPDRRPAAEIIDWTDPGESLWTRDLDDGRRKPLKNTTMQRIAEGIRRHGHPRLEPFADAIHEIGRDDVHQLRERVVPASDAQTVAEAVSEPFLVKYYGTSTSRPLDEPLDTITSGGQKFALCTPYVLGQQSGSRPRSTRRPLPTISTGGAISTITPDPFILPRNGARRGLHSNPAYRPDSRPLHTVTAKNHDGYLVTPYLVPFYGERAGQRPRTHDIERPLPTVPASKVPAAIASPFLVAYYGNGGSQSIDQPLPTVTTRDRFGLVVPECYPLGLDIRFRMLKPTELAAAMGFPDGYHLAGNKTETVEQIGNAVPVHLATTLVGHVLASNDPSLASFGGGITGEEDVEVPEYATVLPDGGDES